MPGPRDKEKMSQSAITDYFYVRKKSLKDKEKLGNALDLILRKKKSIPQLSSSSKLLISVLDNNTKLKARSEKISRKENSNPNVKNSSESANIELDSTKVEPMEISSSSTDEIVLSKEEILQQNVESSSQKINISATSVKKKIKIDEYLRKRRIIQRTISKSLQNDAVRIKKLSKTVESVNINISENKTIPEVSLLEPKKSRTITEESKKPSVINQSQFQTPKKVLPLPSDYKFLGQVFTCIDLILAALMLFKRGEIITFRKLQLALQNMSKYDVTLDHLAQIKTIYPEAYSYEYKKLRTFGLGSRYPQNEMILNPNFESWKTVEDSDSDVFENIMLLKRRRKFYNTLLERVKKEHEHFLQGCRKSRWVIPEEKIKCWHPRFKIENCKSIEKSELPIIHNIKITSAKEFLEKVKECYKVDTNLKNATLSPETVSKPIEKGEQKMKGEDNQAEYYRRLPATAKMLRDIFLSEKKNVLALNLIVQKLQYCCKEKLSLEEIEKHLLLLCESVPKWIHLFNLGKLDRLKFDKNIPFEKVLKILEALAKKN